ncbi:hypothetical protein [Chelativorans sp. YIM 93263]|uniref:hypothetical protein n=1 Tax=Chelativorans sp. YIM 93263 TaxID=2906648 RepID=UPI002379FFCF|nr:hypothetical protein [Chelativorans sp. YIM 93263]
MTVQQSLDTTLPIIRQIHEARSDEERARLLLAVSDAVLMKYRPVFEQACERTGFERGLEYIAVRRAAWQATRGPDGLHKNPLFEETRTRFAAFAGTEGGKA